jgi:V8-like Glu-specific endopeptidase
MIAEKTEERRNKVEDARKYPYCCIGLITGQAKGSRFKGTGFLIGPNIILTCAHNCYSRFSGHSGQ